MATEPEHSRIIAAAAREMLAPLGCNRKGRSRVWHDDRGWWMIGVEFQPFSGQRGSCLNVGAHWLWHAKDWFSYDYGDRVAGFQEFVDAIQFKPLAEDLARRAAREVLALREQLRTVRGAAEAIRGKPNKQIWDHYRAGIADGLLGDVESARAHFGAARAADDRALPWVVALHAKIDGLTELCRTTPDFRSSIADEVVRSRALKKLPPLADAASLWSPEVLGLAS